MNHNLLEIEISDIESEIGQMGRKRPTKETTLGKKQAAPKNVQDMVKKTLSRLSNVEVLNIDLQSGRIELDCLEDTIPSVTSAIIDLGYKIREDKWRK